jgi:hypothetical protein
LRHSPINPIIRVLMTGDALHSEVGHIPSNVTNRHEPKRNGPAAAQLKL